MIDGVVVGAGHAGLAVSWHLRRLGVEHVVLERGRVGENGVGGGGGAEMVAVTWMSGYAGAQRKLSSCLEAPAG